MNIKKFCQFSIFIVCAYFMQSGYAQYKISTNLPECKDWKIIAKELPQLQIIDYPAKHYTHAKLLERLVFMANNLLTPTELENEFGLTFYECKRTYPNQKYEISSHLYFSRGQYPLGAGGGRLKYGEPIDVVYQKFEDGVVNISLNINQKNKINKSDDCVYRNQVIEALGKDWILREISHPYSAWQDKKVNELRQRLFMTFEYVELPYCKNKGGIEHFSIIYNIKG